ncbi:prepilin peptidase [Cryobacterium zongtaii]|uniref:Prepilin leader peptidase/N-methyltransferase n=1 Tax=Cryobacterium zongtaii TaxID=1259217 RepID=A0A2S3ZQ31_9MICO|nr:A24 family peptidase [Cryobacterium zongtaii]POH71017.1 prepilin peptidase [Cryobacterium zongtaii]
MDAALIILAGIFGLLIGSFLNVVICRVPNGRSIVTPPSACPGCGALIRPADNIPVISWLLLRGRCRQCRTSISVRYPIVELGTAVFFAATVGWALFHRPSFALAGSGVGFALAVVAYLYLAAVSVALALIDLDTHTLPDRIVLPSYVVGASLFGTSSVVTGDYESLLGACIGMGALWLFYLLLAVVYPGGMGFGDVKLAGVLGLFLGWLGWGPLVVGAFAAFLLGGTYAIVLVVTRRANRKSGIPFGPWMLAGAWVGIFGGQQLWTAYLGAFGLS